MNSTKFLQFISPIFKPFYGGIGHILMFHRVCQPTPKRIPVGSQLEVSPETLESIITFFKKRGYAFISLDELYQNLLSPHPSKKFVVFTFDDGYIDNFIIAYPILEQQNIPFTIYIATSFPDRTAQLWWYAVDDLIFSHPQLEINLDSQKTSFDCTTPSGRLSAAIFIRKKLKSASPSNFQSLITSIFTKNGMDISGLVKDQSMSWQQIKQLSSDPLVTIGAHTVDHYVLNRLNESEVLSQVQDSRKILTDHLNRSIDHFAYPYGSHNEAGPREFKIIKELGFKTAVTSRFANIFPQHRNSLECLPRLEIPFLSNPAMLELAVNGMIPARKNHLRRIVTT
jgi:peptidoglycan/xylan/chitin deacetylase (PgdA/CDA1 family)